MKHQLLFVQGGGKGTHDTWVAADIRATVARQA